MATSYQKSDTIEALSDSEIIELARIGGPILAAEILEVFEREPSEELYKFLTDIVDDVRRLGNAAYNEALGLRCRMSLAILLNDKGLMHELLGAHWSEYDEKTRKYVLAELNVRRLADLAIHDGIPVEGRIVIVDALNDAWWEGCEELDEEDFEGGCPENGCSYAPARKRCYCFPLILVAILALLSCLGTAFLLYDRYNIQPQPTRIVTVENKTVYTTLFVLPVPMPCPCIIHIPEQVMPQPTPASPAPDHPVVVPPKKPPTPPNCCGKCKCGPYCTCGPDCPCCKGMNK